MANMPLLSSSNKLFVENNLVAATRSSTINATVILPTSKLKSVEKEFKLKSVEKEFKLKSVEKEFNSILYSTPLNNTEMDIPSTEQYEELEHAVKKIKEILAGEAVKEDRLEELIMIDTIQRLGLDHYFKREIHAILERHHIEGLTFDEQAGSDLHGVALHVRLLRQEGYDITDDAFSQFRGNDGKFKQELSKDTRGLMSLFEASHLGIPEDNGMLDEANKFSSQLLKTSLKNAKQSEARIIRSTLGNPYLRSLPRLMAKNFLDEFEIYLKCLHNVDHTHTWTNKVRDLARMDFKMAQIGLQSEITQVHRWWKQLNLTKELKLVRDQPVKWHIWSWAVLPNPAMKNERIELTKAISFIYLIDDIFDVYGTLEELILFTEAVNRWEDVDNTRLPNSIKMCLKALQDTTSDFSHKVHKNIGWNPSSCIKKAWADLCNAFLVEAKWFASGRLPSSSEEYLKNGLISSGTQVVAVYIFYLLGQGINSKSIEHLNRFPSIVSLVATIQRLSDDLGSAKDEDQEGYDGSYIECYMNEHKDISSENAQEIVRQMISEAWKRLNMTCLSPTPFSADFAGAIFNLARLIPIMYNYNQQKHGLPSLSELLEVLLYGTIN